MLALVTCHIFPPLNLIRKKNEFLAPDFPADSSQFFRVHGFTSAVRQMPTAMRSPFAWTNASSGKKRLFCNLGALTQNSWIRPIMSYLWMIGLEMRLFSCGPIFEDYPQAFSQKKKVQPRGFYFWHLRLGLFKSLFWLVKLNMCVCTLLQGQLYFQQKNTPLDLLLDFALDFRANLETGQYKNSLPTTKLLGDQMGMAEKGEKKNMCFAIWARVDTKFLNSSHHVLSVDDWPGDATFFLWANLWRSSASIQSKKVQPLGIYFWPLRLGLLKSLFWLVKVNICLRTLLQSHVKNHTHSINHGTVHFFLWFDI